MFSFRQICFRFAPIKMVSYDRRLRAYETIGGGENVKFVGTGVHLRPLHLQHWSLLVRSVNDYATNRRHRKNICTQVTIYAYIYCALLNVSLFLGH